MKPRTLNWSGMAICALLLLGATTHASGQASPALHLVSSEPAASGRSGFTVTESAFVRDQLEYSRVRQAQLRARPRINRLFYERGIRHPAAEVYVRVFKRERQLEVWVRPQGEAQFQLLKTYGICAAAGKPGPKTRQGDEQVPEGFYAIDLFNPLSEYHLSLRINYPNVRDQIANAGNRLGGNIFIHGDCVSAGCLAMTDEGIEELYWLALEAYAVGQHSIPVHIFPTRLTDDELKLMKEVFSDQPHLVEFWKTLKPGYDWFEQNRRVPRILVDRQGTYRLGRS